MTAGFLWLSTILAYVLEHRITFPISQSELKTVSVLLPGWVGIIVIPVAVTAAYLLGSVMTGLTNPILTCAGAICRRSVVLLERPHRRHPHQARALLTRWNRFSRELANRTRPVSFEARGLILEYIMTTLTKAGATSGASLVFPFDSVMDSLERSSAQLFQAAPTQYQEYDRLKAEAEFRLGVVPPLVVLACELPISGRALVIVAAIIGCTILLAQSANQSRRARDFSATAAYLGYVSILQVQSVAEFLMALDPKPESDGQWMGAIIVGLSWRGFFSESDAALRELTEFEARGEARDYLQMTSPIGSYI